MISIVSRARVTGALLIVLSSVAVGQEFTIFGPRNLSMGRCGVASVNDISAAYVNPAALVREDVRRVGLYVGAAVYSPIDIDDTKDILDSIATTVQNVNPANIFQSAEAIANDIRRLDDDLVATGTAQGLVGVGLGRNFLISYSEQWTTDILVTVDRVNLSTVIGPNFVGFNQTRGDGQLTRFQQIGLTFATSFFDDLIAVGVTGIGGYATNYHVNETVFQLALESSLGQIDWRDRIKSMRQSTFYADAIAGVQVNLFERKLVLGITGAHLLSPSIEREDLADFRIDPQARVAIAWSPFYEVREVAPKGTGADGGEGEAPKAPVRRISNPLTLTIGYDLTDNASMLENGIDSRLIGGGIEFAPSSWFAVRAGVFANLNKTGLGHTITGGFELGALELGAAWSTKRSGDFANDVRAELGVSFNF